MDMGKIDEALAYLKEFDYYTPYQEVVKVIEDYIDENKSKEKIFYRCTNCGKNIDKDDTYYVVHKQGHTIPFCKECGDKLGG